MDTFDEFEFFKKFYIKYEMMKNRMEVNIKVLIADLKN